MNDNCVNPNNPAVNGIKAIANVMTVANNAMLTNVGLSEYLFVNNDFAERILNTWKIDVNDKTIKAIV